MSQVPAAAVWQNKANCPRMSGNGRGGTGLCAKQSQFAHRQAKPSGALRQTKPIPGSTLGSSAPDQGSGGLAWSVLDLCRYIETA
jgi:hypothetical protein